MMETGFDPAVVLTGSLGEMTPEKGVALVRQLCTQLGSDAESFHGNIWPGNIRIDWDGRAVLGEASDAPVADRGADQVEYVAPEFFWDGIGGAAADVYSLGMLLYALCDKGYLPFQPKGGALTDKDRSGALRKRMKGEPIAVPAGVSPLLATVLETALAYEPELRYISAAQMLAALNETDEALPGPEEVGAVPPVREQDEVSEAEELTESEQDTEPEVEDESEAVSDVEPEQESEALPGEDEAQLDMAQTQEAPDAEPEEAVEAVEMEEIAEASEVEEVEEIEETEEVEEVAETEEIEDTADNGEAEPEPAVAAIVAEAVIDEVSEPAEEIIEAEEALDEASEPETAEPEKLVDEPIAAAEPENADPAIEAEEASIDDIIRSASQDDDDFWNTDPEPKKPEKAPTDKERRYTVQKDFEKSSRAKKTSSAVSTTKRKAKKKKISVLVPILCVLAIAIIAGGVYMLLAGNGGTASQDAEQTVSDPFVVVPAEETPTATEAPVPTAEPEDEEQADDADAEEAGDEDEQDDTAVVGSATIDGYTVTAASDTVYVTGSGVNLRSGPSTTYGVEKTLSRGVSLQRTGTVNGWSQVQYEGEEYYVSSTLVSTTDPTGGADSTSTTTTTTTDTTSTGTGTTTSTTGTTTTTTSSGTTTTMTTTSGSTSSGNGSTTTASATVTATRDVVVVTKNDCYLRSGPGTGYTHVATVNTDDVLQRTGTVNGWSRVVYQGKELYISDTLIKTQNASTVTEAVGTLKVSSDVNVRSGADTTYDILGVAKTGDTLTVTGLVDGKWYRVSYDGKDGYVNRNYIKVSDFALVSEASGTVTITSAANVRSGPATSYDILGVAEVDETLTVTGLTDSNWYQVTYNDKVGYVAASLVKAD